MTNATKSNEPIKPVLWTSRDEVRVLYFESEVMARVNKGTGRSYQAFFSIENQIIYGPQVIDNFGPINENPGISRGAINALESWLVDERSFPRR